MNYHDVQMKLNMRCPVHSTSALLEYTLHESRDFYLFSSLPYSQVQDSGSVRICRGAAEEVTVVAERGIEYVNWKQHESGSKAWKRVMNMNQCLRGR